MDTIRHLGRRMFGIGTDDPYRAWRRLSPEYRADVVRLARTGSPHGVPIVRRTAARWATAVLEGRPVWRWFTSAAPYIAVGMGVVVAAAFMGRVPVPALLGSSIGGLAGSTTQFLFLRRRARRVLAANAEP